MAAYRGILLPAHLICYLLACLAHADSCTCHACLHAGWLNIAWRSPWRTGDHAAHGPFTKATLTTQFTSSVRTTHTALARCMCSRGCTRCMHGSMTHNSRQNLHTHTSSTPVHILLLKNIQQQSRSGLHTCSTLLVTAAWPLYASFLGSSQNSMIYVPLAAACCLNPHTHQRSTY